MSAQLEAAINAAWERRDSVTPASADVREAVEEAIELLDSGQVRVAERESQGTWRVNQWLKKAVLLSFRLNDNAVMDGAGAPAFDKVPLKFAGWGENRFREAAFRVVPGAVARRGSSVVGSTDATSGSDARASRTWRGTQGSPISRTVPPARARAGSPCRVSQALKRA